MKKLTRIYFISPNGIKIDMRCGFSSDYVLNQIRTVFAKEFKDPKDFLFPDKELVNVTVKDSCLNTVLTYELKKENAELKEKVSYLEDNLRVARKDRENLQLDVAKGLKEFVKDYPATSLRYLANEKYVEQLTKAKELIEELSSSLSVVGECEEEECELLNRAEQFLKDSEVEK